MAQKGRKKKPSNLRLLQGNPGKKPIPENEPKPPVCPDEILLKKPRGMVGAARKAWEQIAPRLNDMKVLTVVDRTALKLLCEQIGIYEDAKKQVKQEGMTTTTDKGNVIQHPAVGIRNQAFKNIKAMLTEFGMTPSSRTGLSSIPDDPDETGWSEFGG